jgi:hypothetical protein
MTTAVIRAGASSRIKLPLTPMCWDCQHECEKVERLRYYAKLGGHRGAGLTTDVAVQGNKHYSLSYDLRQPHILGASKYWNASMDTLNGPRQAIVIDDLAVDTERLRRNTTFFVPPGTTTISLSFFAQLVSLGKRGAPHPLFCVK